MKTKVLLAAVAVAFSFAVSSCGNKKAAETNGEAADSCCAAKTALVSDSVATCCQSTQAASCDSTKACDKPACDKKADCKKKACDKK